MSRPGTVTAADLAALVAAVRADGMTVIAPAWSTDGAVDYAEVECFEQAVVDGPPPRGSLKRFFLPATEPLFRWSRNHESVHIEEVATEVGPRLVLGARPCDAAALDIVDRVMSWDFVDEFWFGRRRATTVIAIACSGGDSSCFCTEVGLAPDAAAGADLMLTATDDGYHVESMTEAGRGLVQRYTEVFGRDLDLKAGSPLEPHRREAPLEAMSAVRRWLEGNFDDPLFSRLALPCHGCGACAAVCPTCHCFDIVDEPEGVSSGTRRRNWDSCQIPRFTVHASGHNPRADQGARLRQRLMHKLAIYPRRFGEILCTGCGRCIRACPAGIDLAEIISELGRRASAAAPAGHGAPEK